MNTDELFVDAYKLPHPLQKEDLYAITVIKNLQSQQCLMKVKEQYLIK